MTISGPRNSDYGREKLYAHLPAIELHLLLVIGPELPKKPFLTQLFLSPKPVTRQVSSYKIMRLQRLPDTIELSPKTR